MQELDTSKVADKDKDWLRERILPKFIAAYRNGYTPLTCLTSEAYKLPAHPSRVHPDLVKVADDYILKPIEKRLKKVWTWSAEEELEWNKKHSLEYESERMQKRREQIDAYTDLDSDGW